MGTDADRRRSRDASELSAEEVVGRWAISSLSKSAFCRTEGITPGALDALVRELRSGTRPSTAEGFVEVHLQRAGPLSAELQLDLPSGHRLRIPPGFDTGDLERLLAVLEQRSC